MKKRKTVINRAKAIIALLAVFILVIVLLYGLVMSISIKRYFI